MFSIIKNNILHFNNKCYYLLDSEQQNHYGAPYEIFVQ